VVRDVVEQRRKKTGDPKLAGDIATTFKGDPRRRQIRVILLSRIMESAPCSLVLSIASLNDFMLTRENFLLENFCASTFVDTGNFEDLSGIDV
jgi:hypothetical protein